jgi:hypothetical protein
MVTPKRLGVALAILVVLASIAIGLDRTKLASNLANGSLPTTALLKPVDGGPAYLRLEQEHAEVVARFLLSCIEGRMYWNAGIVTTPELSAAMLEKATRNYLEIDSDEILQAQGSVGAQVAESTIWIFRPLDAVQVNALKKAQTLGAWTENGSDFRWGAFMSIENVRGDINRYVEKCI